MELNKEIFEKFLRNQCTDAEAAEVLTYLKEHPDVLEQYIPLDDWLAEDTSVLATELSDRMLQHIKETYEPVRRASVTKLIIRLAVAAVLIGVVVVAGIKLLPGTTRSTTEATVVSTLPKTSAPEFKVVENKTKKAMRIKLSDGSLATLYPNSSLQYFPVFENDKRDLYLKGKAQFKVSKDPVRPFTVYVGGIATTVLGTRFLVTEHQNKKVSVMLMEGMVRVWSKDTADGDRSVILNPGDEMAVTGGQFSSYSLVHSVGENRNNALARSRSMAEDEPDDAMNDLVFKNKKLQDVFKKIEEKFGVTIDDENAPGIKEKLFTGRFLEGDSLDFIVKTVCNLYGLQYRIEGNTITITAK